MKRLLTLCAAIALFACSKPEKVDYLIFSGEITNNTSDSIYVYNDEMRTGIAISDSGQFSDTLRVEEGYYSFRLGRESSALYLEPGKNLHLKIDPAEFDESIRYAGEGAAANNVLAKLYLIEEQLIGNSKDFFSLEEADYLAKAKELEDSSLSVVENSDASLKFKQDQMKDARYNYASNLLVYESRHAYYAKMEDFKVSEEFSKELPDIKLDDEASYKRSKAYRNYIETAFSVLTDGETDSLTSFTQAMEKAIQNWKSEYIRNELINGYAFFILSPNEELEATYGFLKSTVTDSTYLAEYDKKYAELQHLKKGEASPTFSKYENHAGDSTSFSDLMGKYTYIDVWATWCGPCIREIPSLKEVEEKYHGKNIQFVSISIDQPEDHDTWVKMVNDKELGGIQLMADQAWQSDFVKAYMIDGIPRFILVDPEGNIVSADAPRPSSPKLISLFDELGI